jgi:hypothetical protein
MDSLDGFEIYADGHRCLLCFNLNAAYAKRANAQLNYEKRLGRLPGIEPELTEPQSVVLTVTP